MDMHGEVPHVGVKPYKRQKRDYNHLFGARMQHWTISEIRDFFALCRFRDYSRWGLGKHVVDRIMNAVGSGGGDAGSAKFDSYFKFAVVRNPYDRLVSGFAWLDGNWHKRVQPGKDEFTRYVDQIRSEKLYEQEVHLLPQYKFLELDGKIGVDKVLHQEDLSEDFEALCRELDLDLELPKRMVSRHKQSADYFDERSREIVYQIYRKDFEYFEYDK